MRQRLLIPAGKHDSMCVVAPQAMTAERQVPRGFDADHGNHIDDASRTSTIQNASESDYTRHGPITPEPGPIMSILPKGTLDQENTRVNWQGLRVS